jgi:hypothetical protein
MHKQRLDGAREGDGKKVAGGANARARLETPPGFAARSRSNNVAKASMAVGERKAALPPPPPPAASNGGKAGMFLEATNLFIVTAISQISRRESTR